MTGRDKNDFERQICILVLYFIKFSGTSISGIVKCARVCCPGTAGQIAGLSAAPHFQKIPQHLFIITQ